MSIEKDQYCGIGKKDCPIMLEQNWKKSIKKECWPCHKRIYEMEGKEDFCQIESLPIAFSPPALAQLEYRIRRFWRRI